MVDKLLEQRKENAYLKTLPVKIDQRWLASQSKSLSSVLDDGEILTLNRTANTHQGATNFAITSLLSPEIVRLAEQAANAIPLLDAVGVDLMINSLNNVDQAVLLELNASGSLLLHHYPVYGPPVNVAKLIIDSMHRRYLQRAG